ncbi:MULTISPECIES: colicin E3/pyocin S6 family cytotoxin [unclassified Pseudomonas]|uniref:colicin E3/pyocin S6 family cytotoxin n=2 Tax=Pseudomonas TaxID=286 RepID=UPI000C8872F8|nr:MULTISPECIES: colicin E3/pyocin S6 family cytotoxin [unclassified Pseudomonas]PNA03392.1 toxin [Pseudomonas sp. FW305-BF15]PNB78906.1 toxin [Pseudomonas sp. FW305-BF6]
MARKSDIPRIQNPPSGDGHHITTRYMTATELAEQNARQKKYDEMQARQQAYEDRFLRQSQQPNQHSALGCVFTKSCNLPDGVINHESPAGFIPVERLADFGAFTLLGGRELDAAGNITLKRIGGAKLPSAIGTLLLGGSASIGTSTSTISSVGAITGGVAAGALAGMVALLWPSNLGDSSLYTEEQLRSLKEGRTRIRLQVEQQPDGSLKGYGYNTQKRPDWEMIPVVQFTAQGSRQVADFGNGVTLTWTPAVDSSSTSGIPPLEGAPQTPTIWIYPPTEQADKIIVNPIYPPEYEDFILVFPADSGVQPLYVVLSRPALGGDIKYHRPPRTLPAFPDAQPVKSKSSVQGGGGKRSRWKDRKGRIYEWDSKTGAIELYNKQGKHLGEFNHETGEQIDPADPERSTPK